MAFLRRKRADSPTAEEHPDLAVKRKLIVLHRLEQPTGETHAFLGRFAAVLQDHDVAFEVWMLADEQ